MEDKQEETKNGIATVCVFTPLYIGQDYQHSVTCGFYFVALFGKRERGKHVLRPMK
jgi:hypothetical protein